MFPSSSSHQLLGKAVGNQFTGRQVCCKGDVHEIADPQQALNIRLVRVSEKRIDDEDHRIHLALSDARSDLSVAAERPGKHAFNGQPGCVDDALARRSRRDQPALRQDITVRHCEGDDVILLAIVGN